MQRLCVAGLALFWVSLVLWLLAQMALVFTHCFYNLSGSAPVGIWKVEAQTKPAVGDWVLACLPVEMAVLALQRGYLGSGACDGAQPVLKILAAAAGDRVRRQSDGLLYVNGRQMPDSAPVPVDASGMPMPIWPEAGGIFARQLQENEFWLMSRHPLAFDSRYFGTVPVVRVVRPVLVFGR